ncbi:MAG: hypothetical protein M1831_000685 [Alyxoria varia]|nr:MAG: hypothetical protein M1831_000685 [Alyxoria varia]
MASAIPTDYEAEFNSLASLPAQNRSEGCATLLQQIFSGNNVEENLIAFLFFVLDGEQSIAGVNNPKEAQSLISVRPLLSSFIQNLSSCPSSDVKVAVARVALSLIQPRVVSFEEQDAQLKYLLADAHEANEEFKDSALALASINLNTSSRATDETEKAQIWVRIARCYLEEEDPVGAATNINKAKQVIHLVKSPELRVQYHLSQARILDSQRNFLDAANAYHTISYEPAVDEDDRLRSLNAAITCAVLAPAGPLRSRTLAKLYKDDRAPRVEDYGILEKIFLDRMVTAEEVSSFASKLSEHQRAKTADGNTVVERAMLDHNLLGASRMYLNISIDDLGSLLGVSGERAEQYAAQMIEQGRLRGHIDQIDRRIFFEGQNTGQKSRMGTQSLNVAGKELKKWDANVQELAEEVEKVTTLIQTQYPVSCRPASQDTESDVEKGFRPIEIPCNRLKSLA